MSNENVENGSFSVMALESGIKYATLEEAPDVPLLIEIVGIRPDDLAKISHGSQAAGARGRSARRRPSERAHWHAAAFHRRRGAWWPSSFSRSYLSSDVCACDRESGFTLPDDRGH